MNRRNFVSSSAIAAGALLAGSAYADKHNHGHHHKSKKLNQSLDADSQNQLIDSTAECLRTGKVCLSHCARELAQGNSMMGECNVSIQNMLVACQALNDIAHNNTLNKKALQQFVAGCKAICQECHDQCEKHADHHMECKACMKSCKKCIDVCNKIIG
jgi:Cys-rich four helix bundle protein (predicted Tat secretion target)